MDNDLRQIHDQLRKSQEKYTYFLLAVCASSIALSVQMTKIDIISYSLIPLGLAIVCWGASFFSGCRNIQYVNSTLYSNSEYLKIMSGIHPEVGNHPQIIQAACEGIMRAMKNNSDVISGYGIWQFRLAVSGGILFVVWHVIEMWLRTAIES